MNKFAATVKLLADAHVNFVVIGGYAAMLHGSAFLTQDLDICYERSPENLKWLATALAPIHPRLRGAPEGIPFSLDERTLTQGMNFTLQTDWIDLDLLGEISGVGQFHDVVRNAEKHRSKWGRLSCGVIRHDHQVKSKLQDAPRTATHCLS